MNLKITKDILNKNYVTINYSLYDNFSYKFIIKYIGILLSKYGNDALLWLDNQQKRDNFSWHITVFNVQECNKNKELLYKYKNLNITDIKYVGLGSISKENNKTFYIICSSEIIDKIREDENLNKRYLHITLAFTEKDLFHLNKDINTLININ